MYVHLSIPKGSIDLLNILNLKLSKCSEKLLLVSSDVIEKKITKFVSRPPGGAAGLYEHYIIFTYIKFAKARLKFFMPVKKGLSIITNYWI